MVFSSIPFLFYFLPAVMLIYYVVPFRWKNTVLVIFSLIFYALGEPVYILIMLACIAVNFTAGLLVERQWLHFRKLWMVMAVSVSLGIVTLLNLPHRRPYPAAPAFFAHRNQLFYVSGAQLHR